MAFDLSGLPSAVERTAGDALSGQEISRLWMPNPATCSQIAFLPVACISAFVLSVRMKRQSVRGQISAVGRRGQVDGMHELASARLLWLAPLGGPILKAVGRPLARGLFVGRVMLGFDKRVFMFLFVQALVRGVVSDALLKLRGRYGLMPPPAICSLAVPDDAIARSAAMMTGSDKITYSAMSLKRRLCRIGDMIMANSVDMRCPRVVR